jgi:hypothetical protein
MRQKHPGRKAEPVRVENARRWARVEDLELRPPTGSGRSTAGCTWSPPPDTPSSTLRRPGLGDAQGGRGAPRVPGVVIRDRLALYWKLKTAKHGTLRSALCRTRDYADTPRLAPRSPSVGGARSPIGAYPLPIGRVLASGSLLLGLNQASPSARRIRP